MQEMKRLFEVFGDVFHTAGNYNWISRVERAKENTLETELRSWLHRLLFKHTKPLQHIFYDAIMAPASNNMVDTFFGDSFISDGEKARFRSTSAQHAGKWLAAIPKEGLIMHSQEFKTAMLIRLGMKVVIEDLKCTCSSHSNVDTLGVHLLSCCGKGNKIGKRHKYLTDYFVDLMSAANQSPSTESHVNPDSTASNGGERSNITLRRQTLFPHKTNHQHFDVTVINPSAKSYTKALKTSKENGTAGRKAHMNKINYYSRFIEREDFHPLVFETFGYWTEEVTMLIRTCCHIISAEKHIEYSVLVNYWFTKLSFILQWENAIIILEREHQILDAKQNKYSHDSSYRGRRFYELRAF